MIYFDFFKCNKTELIISFCQYFNVEVSSAKEYFDTVNPEELDVEMVIDAFSISKR